MADDLPSLDLIVTNPNLSGRVLKAMILLRADDGSFGVHSDHPDLAINDGQTTIIHIPVGARLVISEEHEPALAHVMAAHPHVVGARHPPGTHSMPSRPLNHREEARQVALESRETRTVDEQAELDALQLRAHPAT